MRCPALVLSGLAALSTAFFAHGAIANDLVVTQAFAPVATPTLVAPTTVIVPPVPVTTFSPVVAQPVPVTTFSPVVAPVTTLSPVVTVPRRWTTFTPVVPAAPAPVVAFSPVVPAAPVPVTTFSPVVTQQVPVTTFFAPAPTVTTFSPVVAPAVAAPAVGVRSKVVYVPGQPIRNFFRTITP
jgi:hypothetical protein